MKTNLKQIRKDAGWANADDFAAFIGIPAKTYRNYEQGVRKIGLDVASEICNALGCTIEDLISVSYKDIAAEIFRYDSLESDEIELVAKYREMDSDHRKMLLQMAHSFAMINDPDAVWTDENGNKRTGAEIRGIR